MLKSAMIQELARLGAPARLDELRTEIADILRAFPDLERPARPGRRKRQSPADATELPATASRRRKRKPMTAAQRRAVGIRMRKYWASRRQAEVGR